MDWANAPAVKCAVPRAFIWGEHHPHCLLLAVRGLMLMRAMPTAAEQPDPLKPASDKPDGESDLPRSSPPMKKPFRMVDATATRVGGGLQIIGAGAPSTNKRPDDSADGDTSTEKPHAESTGSQGIVVSPHPYPDLPQAPTRKEFSDEDAFEEAMAGWRHRVAPIVAMRLKYGKPHTEDGAVAMTESNDKQLPTAADSPDEMSSKSAVRIQFKHDATAEQIYEGMLELFAAHPIADNEREGEEATEPPSAE